jgi:phage shock protein C
MIIISAKWTLIAYGLMGVAVLASRLLIRKPKAAKSLPHLVEAAARREQPAEDMAIAA